MGYNLLIYGVYWGYNPLTNHLLTSWDIQVGHLKRRRVFQPSIFRCENVNFREGNELKKKTPPITHKLPSFGGAFVAVFIGGVPELERYPIETSWKKSLWNSVKGLWNKNPGMP